MDIVVMAQSDIAACDTARLREALQQSLAELRRWYLEKHR